MHINLYLGYTTLVVSWENIVYPLMQIFSQIIIIKIIKKKKYCAENERKLFNKWIWIWK